MSFLLIDPAETDRKIFRLGDPLRVNGGGSGGEDIETIEVDWMLTFEAGTAGDPLTAADLNAAMVGGTTETWTRTSAANTHTYILAGNSAPLTAADIGGDVETGAGTRSVRFDLTEKASEEATHDVWTVSIPAGHGDIALSWVMTPNIDRDPAGSADGRIDLFEIKFGGDFAIAQHQVLFSEAVGSGGAIYAHGNNAVESTFSSSGIVLTKGEKVHVTMKYHATDARVRIAILRYSDGALLGVVECESKVGLEPTAIDMKSYLVSFGGTIDHDSVQCQYDELAMIPMVANFTLPAPTSPTVAQIGVLNVRTTCTAKGLSFTVERDGNDDNWVELADDLAAPTWDDSTVVDEATYRYRWRANLETHSSAWVTSDPITVNNATFAATQRTFITGYSLGPSSSQTGEQDALYFTTGSLGVVLKELGVISHTGQYGSFTFDVDIRLASDDSLIATRTANLSNAGSGNEIYTLIADVELAANTAYKLQVTDQAYQEVYYTIVSTTNPAGGIQFDGIPSFPTRTYGVFNFKYTLVLP